VAEHQIKQIDKEINKINDDLEELRGNAEDFEADIKTSTIKEKLYNE